MFSAIGQEQTLAKTFDSYLDQFLKSLTAALPLKMLLTD